MKTIRKILILSILLAAFVSCRKEPVMRPTRYQSGNLPILAFPYLDEDWAPVTKAPSAITDIRDNTTLQDAGFEGIGVYAFYTGDEDFSASKTSSQYSSFGTVLNKRQFTYNSGSSVWENTGEAEFWPTRSGDKLTLFAFAPWSTWNGVVSYNGNGGVPSIQYDNYVAQNLSVTELEKQRDILWGTNTAGLPHRNVEAGNYTPEGTVDFHFRHAVAKVRLNVKGSLPGEVRTQTSAGTINTQNGTAGDPENGATTSSVGDPVFQVANNPTYYRDVGYVGRPEWTYVRYYHATQTQTETESIVQTRYRTNTVTATGARFSISGQRYLVHYVTMKGFNKTGTLLLDNTSAYSPLWTNVTRFTGNDPEYVLNGDNVLSQSLQYVAASTVQNNFSTYTGITETPTEMMSGYFLYAIPRESSAGDRISVGIKYHKLNVSGTLTVNQTRQVVQKQTRTISRTRTRTRNSEEIKVTSDYNRWSTPYSNYASHESDYTFSADWGDWGNWSSWSSPSWSAWSDDSSTDWTITSETLTNATVNYNDDTAPELSGEIITSLQGGRVYDINLIVAGDVIELDVVPQPWALKDNDFDYNANINDVIQALTYDSSYIDYADAQGNVYINNRMGKFYFKLGAGKYSSWQASLVGDAAFGFTDENGNFLQDEHGNRVSSIRNAIDPDVMNYIYVKPIDSEATVTSHAKLRIYYIDATGDAVVALNLVNMAGVTEWTIWQNAN